MANNPFEDPFTNPGSDTVGLDTMSPAVPRRVLPTMEEQIAAQAMRPSTQDAALPSAPNEETYPDIPPFQTPYTGQDLLSEPMDKEKGPTAFQQKKINWSDGGEDLSRPRLQDVAPKDWLEVDYTFGKKEGATTKPVEAANVFGRQFTAAELQQDEEGRRLLDLMNLRRSGKYNEGGSLYQFGKGWSKWSQSDIPFYGWVSDIGTSVGEAIDISKTMKKLQNGEKVTPHEAIQARRYMLQQEIEGTRTTAYQIGETTKQMVPFMAEMATTAAIGAALTSWLGPGAGIGAAVGALVGGAKWLITGGKVGVKAGTKYVARKGMESIAKKAVGELTAAEIGAVTKAGVSAFGKEGFALAYREAFNAAKGALPGATSAEIRRKAVSTVAGNLATSTVNQTGKIGSITLRGLLDADSQLAASAGARKAAEEFLARQAGVAVGSVKSTRAWSAAVRKGLENIGGFESEVWKAFRNDLTKGMVKGVDGKLRSIASVKNATESVGTDFIREALANSTGQYINPKFAESAAKLVFDDAVRTVELQLGANGFLSSPTRFARYLGEHITRGLVQSEYSIFRGGLPTAAHSGMSTFFRSSDALKEGLGRVFIEAPVTAAVQLGLSQTITAPLFAAASGHNPLDVTFKGQLGFQTAALMRGDRDAMDSARMCAIGSMFAEYASENAGRGLGLMVGGAAGTATFKTAQQVTAGIDIAKNAVKTSRFTRQAGSLLSKAVDMVYGTGDLHKIGTDKLVGFAMSRTAEWAKKSGRQFAETDVRNALTTMSLKGTSQSFRDTLETMGIKSAQAFRKKVVEETQELNRFGVLRACFGAEMLRRGLSPDEIVRKFRQMGYGGVLEEMGEERVGDFVRGLMGWDDTSSQATYREKLESMFSGFLDPKQLMVEAVSFAIPGAVRSFTMSSQKWLMNGGLTPAKEATTRLKNLERNSSTRPRVVHETGTEANADALAARASDIESLRDKAYGTKESYKGAVTSNAAAAFGNKANLQAEYDRPNADGKPDTAERTQAKGRLASVLGAQDEAHMAVQLERYADSFMAEPDEARLENALADAKAVDVLGEAGVDAVRREWARHDGHRFSDDTQIAKDIKAYEDARKASVAPEVKLYTSAKDAAKALYTASPVLGRNSAQVAEQEANARAGSNLEDVMINEDVQESATDDGVTLYRDMGRSAFFAPQEGGAMRRFLSRFVGAIGAVTTGELSLVSRNPAMWLANDRGLDPMLNVRGLEAYAAGVISGYRKIRDSFDEPVRKQLDEAIDKGTFQAKVRELKLDVPTIEAMEAAGEDVFRSGIKDIMGAYLTGCGYMMMTREAADDAALKVVAARHRKGNSYDIGDDTVSAYDDPRFREKWSEEIEKAHEEVVDELVRVASSAMDYNSKSVLGSNRTVVTVDVTRAIRNGTKAEVLAAILESPAFKGVARVVNVSGHSELETEVAFSSAANQVADIGRLLDIDTETPGRDLTEAELLEASQVLGIDINKSDAENQAAVRRMVRGVRLAVESANVEFEDSRVEGRRAFIVPVQTDAGRGWIYRSVANGKVTDTAPFQKWTEARDAATSDEFVMREKKLVVSSLRDFVSTDATSLVLLRNGNDRDAARAAFLNAMGARADAPLFVREDRLPPYLRKMEYNEGGVRSYDWVERGEDAAERCARKFREELDLANEAVVYGIEDTDVDKYLPGQPGKTREDRKARMQAALKARNSVFGVEGTAKPAPGYETLAAKILEQAGVRRNVNPVTKAGLSTMGISSDAWIMPVSSVSTKDMLVLSPDYATEGHGEALLRMGLRTAIESYVGIDDADRADRLAVLGASFRAFEEAGEELATELESQFPEKAKRVRQAMAATLRRTVDGVSSESLAAIASSSLFFSCERSLRGDGNGYLYSPELARVADRFRNKPIYSLFASLMDEAAGGIGFFHLRQDSKGNAVASATGLARFLDVYCDDADRVLNGRKSAVFTDSKDDRPVFPYLPSFKMRNVKSDEILTDGTVVADFVGDARDNRFSGDVKGGYMVNLSRKCSDFTTKYVDRLGSTRSVLSTAEVYRLLSRDADLFGGTTRREPAKKVTAGAKESVVGVRSAARRVLDQIVVPDLQSGIDAKTAHSFGAALRMMSDSSGADARKFREELGEYLLDRGVPVDVVSDVKDSFDNVDISERQVLKDRGVDPDAVAQDGKDAVQDADNQAMADGQAAEDVYGLRREAMFVDSDDVSAISKVIRWVFPAQGGSIAFTLNEVKDEVARGLLSEAAVDAAEKRWKLRHGEFGQQLRDDVTRFVEAMNPYADLSNLTDAYAKDPFFPSTVGGHKETVGEYNLRVDRILDNVIKVLLAQGRYDLGLVMSTIRNVPARDGRRLKFLEMLVHLTPCEADQVTLKDEGFVVDRVGSVAEHERTPQTLASSYSMVLEAPFLRAAVRTGKTEKVAEALAQKLVAVRSGTDPAYVSVKKFSFVKDGASWKSLEQQGFPTNKDGYALLCGDSAAEATQIYETLSSVFGDEKADFGEYVKSLDRLVEIVRNRAEGCAKALDLLLGTGSDYARAFRSRSMFGRIRRRAVEAYDGLKSGEAYVRRERRDAIVNLFQMANYFSACPSVTNKTSGNFTVWRTSQALADAFEEPLEALAEKYGLPCRNDKGALAWMTDGFSAVKGKRVRKTAEELTAVAQDYAAVLAKGIGSSFDRDDARDFLHRMAVVNRIKCGSNLDYGTDVRRATKARLGTDFNPNDRFERPLVAKIFDDYIASGAQSSRTMAGRSLSLAEAAKERAVTALPCMLPALARACASDLFKIGGAAKELQENGMRWADGSLPIVSVLGAKDSNGSLFDKAALAGILRQAILREQTDGLHADRYLFPLFRADKPSCYALQVPARIVREWVDKYVADEKLRAALPVAIRKYVEAAVGRGEGEEEVPATADYEAAEALLAHANGQSQIDAKRVQVTMSVGVPVNLYAANEDGSVDPDAGFRCITTMGGVTGTQATGSYFIQGCATDRVSALSEGSGTSIAEKLHVFGLQYNVNLKKGQGFAFGLGCDEAENDEHLTLDSYRAHQRVLRREIEDDMGSRLTLLQKARLPEMEGILDPLPAKEDTSASEEDYHNAKQAHDYAVGLMEEFLAKSTYMSDDLETNKAGLFGGRSGFWYLDEKVDEIGKDGKAVVADEIGKRVKADGYDELVVTVELPKPRPVGEDGKPVPLAEGEKPETEKKSVVVLQKDADGNWENGRDLVNWSINIADETKNGQVPVAMVVGAVCATLGKDLSASQVGNIESTFRRPDGSAFRGRLADVLTKGDRLSVRWDEANKVARLKYFTRSMIAQIVANNSNSSKPSEHHTFPTNTTRDEEILEMISNAWRDTLRDASETKGFTDAHIGFSALQLAMLGRSEEILKQTILADPDIQNLIDTRPDDNGLAEAVSDKVRSFYAKQCIVGFCGTHGVMAPSAVNGHVLLDDSRFKHVARLDPSPYATRYDIDLLKPADVYGKKERTFYGQDRGYASGLVNTREKAMRYGWYLDETAFAAQADKLVEETDELKKRIDAIRRATGAPVAKARLAAKVEALFVLCRKASEDGKRTNAYRKAILSSFRDYTGNLASDGWNADTVSFDDLFRKDGTFDLAAVDFIEGRTVRFPGEKEESRRVYVGGSFFIAHRSPSGNIEAYSGVARASAPVSWSKKADGKPGKESVYTLDGITMYTQGSDTDGDSAGVQVRKSGNQAVSDARIAEFVRAVAALPAGENGWNTDALWRVAHSFGFTETKSGVDVIREDVVSAFARAVFDAQVENYRRAPVYHQGFVGTSKGEDVEMKEALLAMRGKTDRRNAESKDGRITDDVFYGYEFVEYYREHPEKLPEGGRIYDLGFAGRQPVGTNAVYEEPVTARTRERILGMLKSNVPQAVRDMIVDGKRMDKLFKSIVDKVAGKGTTSVTDAARAADTSDAASDSAGARGKSVFHQSRFVRAFAREFGLETMPVVSRESGSYQYSPLIDFDSHVDGISNNLFDTLKEMFATRAGWTKAMLPYFLGQCAYEGCRAAARGERVDSAFFLAQAVNFLCDVSPKEADREAGFAYNVRSTMGRVAMYTHPVTGRQSVIDQAEACGILPEGRENAGKETVRDVVREFADKAEIAFTTAWRNASEDGKLIIMASRMTTANAEKFAEYKTANDEYRKLCNELKALKARDEDGTPEAKDLAKRVAEAESRLISVGGEDAVREHRRLLSNLRSAKSAKLREDIADRLSELRKSVNPYAKTGTRLEKMWTYVADKVLDPIKSYGDRVDYLIRAGWDPATFLKKRRNAGKSVETFGRTEFDANGEGYLHEDETTLLQENVGNTLNAGVSLRSFGYMSFDRTLAEAVDGARSGFVPPLVLADKAVCASLFRKPVKRKAADGTEYEAYYKNYKGFAEGEDIRNNQDRLVHLVGLVAGDLPRVRALRAFFDSFGTVKRNDFAPEGEETSDEITPNTASFVTGLSDLVHRISLSVASGLVDTGDANVNRLLSSLDASNGEINCSASFSSADADALKDGFRTLMGSSFAFDYREDADGGMMTVSGATLAQALMLHAAITKPFGATMDYRGKSNLPYVFDDAFVANELESKRKYVMFDPTVSLLTAVKPVEVKTGGRPIRAYDVAKTWTLIDAAMRRFDKPESVVDVDEIERLGGSGLAVRDESAERFMEALRTGSKLPKDRSFDRFQTENGDAFRSNGTVRVAKGATSVLGVQVRYADAMLTKTEFGRRTETGFLTRHKNFEKPYVDDEGKIHFHSKENPQYVDTVEEAFNAALELRVAQTLESPVRHAEADSFYETNGRGMVLARKFVSGANHERREVPSSQRVTLLKAIIQNAMFGNQPMYDTFSQMRDFPVRHPDPSMMRAINDIVDGVVSGEIPSPASFKTDGAKEAFASAKGGEASAGSTGVIRANFVDRIEEVFPNGELSVEQATMNIPQAVTDAFKALFGDKVKVEPVVVSGSPACLLKVTRDTGKGKVVTFVSYGEALGYDSTDEAKLESMLTVINSRRKELDPDAAPLTKADVERLTGGNTDKLVAMARASGRTLGESKKFVSDLGFAPFMSGIIRLDHKADFSVLFHEYYHQMIGCFRDNGLVDEEDLAVLDARFASEEEAADAYSEYLTGRTKNDFDGRTMLKDYDGENDPHVKRVFDNLRRAATALAAMQYRGDNDAGDPCFVANLVMSPNAPLGEFSDAEVARAAKALLLEPGRFDRPYVMSGVQSLDNSELLDLAFEELANGQDAEATVLAGAQNLEEPAGVEPEVTPEEPAPSASEEGGRDVVDSVSKFLTLALKRAKNSPGADFDALVRSCRIGEIATGRFEAYGENNQLIFNVRALLRYTALAEGFEIESHGELTELGKRLLTNENVAVLALRLLDAANVEMAEENRDKARDKHDFASHAGAARTLARALDYIAPASYGSHSKALADKASAEFRHVADVLSAKADAETDEAIRGNLREQAGTLYETARLVGVYADAIARGKDLHYLLTDPVENSGSLIGLFTAMVTGGASFHENGGWGNLGNGLPSGPNVSIGPDGVRRYADGSSALGLDEDVFKDPAVTAGFDYAAQAFYVSIAARSYNAQVHGKAKKDKAVTADLVEGLGEIDPLLTQDDSGLVPRTPSEWYEKVDCRNTAPDWILANPGMWLQGDMQKSLAGINMRDMMTDHSIRAVTESAYRLCADFSQFFGMDTLAGDGVRTVKFETSKLGRNASGDFAVADDYAHTVTNFSQTRGYLFGIFNLGEKRTGDPMTSEDLRDIDLLAGQTIKAICGNDRNWISEIRVRDIAYQSEVVARLEGDYMKTMSPAAVLKRLAEQSPEPGKGYTSLDAMLVRLIETVPMSVLKGNNDRADWRTVDDAASIGDGLYADLLRALVRAKSEAAAELAEKTHVDGFGEDETPGEIVDFDPLSNPDVNLSTVMAQKLVKYGFASKGKKRDIYLSIPVARLAKAWDASEAKAKLVRAGRPESMLNLHYWANRFGKEVSKVNTAASKSSYLSNGAGANIALAGNRTFWWYGGNGAHGRNVARFRKASDLFRGMVASGEEKISKVQNEVFGRIEKFTPTQLKKRAFNPDGSFNLPIQQLGYLAKLVGAKRDGASFSNDRFARDVASGKYETGRVSIRRDASVLDATMLINRVLSEKNFEDIVRASDLPTAERQKLLDMRTVCDRLAAKVAETVPGLAIPMSEEQQFLHGTGELGTSMTAPEVLVQMCRDLTTAERFRGCFAQMLTTVASDGSPLFVVSPTDALARTNGMPDEYWGALARQTIRAASTKMKGVVAYDEGLTGVENMQRVYDSIAGNEESRRHYSEIPLGKYNAELMFEKPILCFRDAKDPSGNVDAVTALQGGEAECYMKQLLATLNAPTTHAAWRYIDTVSSWTKIASVGFSAFFQIATVFESPVAAAGFWNTFLGMSKTGTRLNRAVGRKLKRLGGSGAFNADLPMLSDLAGLINSDDPMLVEARELCDLMGMPLDPAVPFVSDENQSNPVLGSSGVVQRQCRILSSVSERYGGARFARGVRKSLDFMYKHPTDYTFNVVLNGVKMAVVMQTMRRLREECRRGNRPFDPVRELRRYSAYVNAEIGGIDPARYAWATPKMRHILSNSMFSWQWTVGAWEAGGGAAVSDLVFGGHNSTPESRQWAFIRWMRMLGIVKFGVPVFLQAALKALSMAMNAVLPPDDEDKDGLDDVDKDLSDMPWLCLLNEQKAGALAFDVTPILKIAAKIPYMKELKGADIPVISSMIPAYVGGGRNTTNKRRYYMHFGKQSDEFFRWFEDPISQAIAKTSIPMQKVLEGMFGRLQPQGYSKAFADKTLAERWLNFDLTNPDESALANLVWSMTSFSAQSIAANPDAGLFAAVGPMRMGQSKRSTRLRIVERLKEFAEDGSTTDPWNYRKNRAKLNLLCTDILREAQLNGVDPAAIMSSAIGDVTKGEYLKVMSALPKDVNENRFDVPKLREAVAALTRLNRRSADIVDSIVQKYKNAGTDVKRNPMFRRILSRLVKTLQTSPFLFGDDDAEKLLATYLTNPEKVVRSTNAAERGGEVFGNFLATDEVPETLFGVPIVTKEYTEEDLAFFEEHPEAGGYYDLGEDEGGTPSEPPTGGPTRGALKAKPARRYVTLPSGSFSSLFESKPVAVKGKDGKTYYKPTRDKAGKYDIGGYRSYWSATQGKLVAHSNDGLLPEKAYLDGKKRLDAYFNDVTNKVYAKHGVDAKTLGKGLDTAARDIVFNTGGDDFLNASPKFAKIVSDLKAKGMKPNDAFGVALALEQDSYGWQNDRRFAARGGLVMDELSKSEDPVVRKFADAYRTGWESVKDYGYRNDGKTRKGTGWLGELKTSDGGVATEYTSQSNAVKVNGKRIDFPTLVPTLSKDEIRMMTDDIIPKHKEVPDAIMQKAVDHALSRLKVGQSVFANDGPSNAGMEDTYGTNWERHKAGMREASKVADALGLEYSARGNK